MGPRRTSFLALTLFAAACVKEPVDWGDVAYRDSVLGDPDTRSAIMSANLPAIPGTTAPCIQSVRSAAIANELVRVWWWARADSSVVLSIEHSPDLGASWQRPIEIDGRDRGRRGCARPAPGVSYDSVSKYVYVVYFVEAADGAGVFFAHSMDDGGMFHSPVPVVYGNTPSAAAVAGRGDSVVAVFEDPNSTTPRIGIVLSRTTGHIFEQRDDVTPEEIPARAPWVALAHDTITVWWRVPDRKAAPSADRIAYRIGVWK
jgi:hypothetical protein